MNRANPVDRLRLDPDAAVSGDHAGLFLTHGVAPPSRAPSGTGPLRTRISLQGRLDHLVRCPRVAGLHGGRDPGGVARGVAGHHRREAGRERSEERIRKVLQDLPVAIAVASLQPDQRIFYRNTLFDRIFGWTPQEIPTHEDWFVRAYPDDAYRRPVIDRWTAEIARADAQQGQVTPHGFRVTCRDGQV